MTSSYTWWVTVSVFRRTFHILYKNSLNVLWNVSNFFKLNFLVLFGKLKYWKCLLAVISLKMSTGQSVALLKRNEFFKLNKLFFLHPPFEIFSLPYFHRVSNVDDFHTLFLKIKKINWSHHNFAIKTFRYGLILK